MGYFLFDKSLLPLDRAGAPARSGPSSSGRCAPKREQAPSPQKRSEWCGS
jgi:hypothetical protein